MSSELAQSFAAHAPLTRPDNLPSQLVDHLKRVLVKIELSDTLVLIFIVSLVRQFFWGLEPQVLAWTLAALVGAAICLGHVGTRESTLVRRQRSFWLVVALPLLVLFLLNVPRPDDCFDVLNYHLLNADRALRGWPFIAGDFFPTIIQVNPAPDMVNGLFRVALGYRFGTFVNFLAFLWIAMIVEKFLRPYLRNHWLRAGCTLLIISTELLLYLLNVYLIDLLALPLLLEATYLTLNFAESKKKNYALLHIALFLGISTAFKLTNLAFVIPIGMMCAFKAFSHRKEIRLSYLGLAGILCVAPMIPFSLFLYRQTGSPLFPFYNSFFKSSYVAFKNYDDAAHGPKKWWEIIVWPIMVVFYPERLSEMSGLVSGYTGRIAVAYVVAILGVATRTIDKKLRTICFITLISSVLWSITNGNGRYGLYLELMGGVAAIGVLVSVYQSQMKLAVTSASASVAAKARVVVILFGGLLLVQLSIAYHHVYIQSFFRAPQGNIRYGVEEETKLTYREAFNVFRDHSATSFLLNDQRQALSAVDVWVNSCSTTSGIQVLLKPEIPIISVTDYLGVFDLLEPKASKLLLARTLAELNGKRMFTLVPEKRLPEATKFVKRAGLRMGQPTLMQLPFFSGQIRKPFFLIEVTPANTESSSITR